MGTDRVANGRHGVRRGQGFNGLAVQPHRAARFEWLKVSSGVRSDGMRLKSGQITLLKHVS